MEWLDRASDWIADRLTWLPEILLLPALVWLAYLAARWLVGCPCRSSPSGSWPPSWLAG